MPVLTIAARGRGQPNIHLCSIDSPDSLLTPILPPQVITSEALDFLTAVLHSGGMLTGAGDPSLETIGVICNPPHRSIEAADDSTVATAPEPAVGAGHSEPLPQSRAPLWEALAEAAGKADAPFYFPGHKKGGGAPANLKAALGGEVRAERLTVNRAGRRKSDCPR
jgi:hypothetical protein